MSPKYVRNVVFLLEQGEERLIEGVQRGSIPLTTALAITCAIANDPQNGNGEGGESNLGDLLQEAYENCQLKGRQIIEDQFPYTLSRRSQLQEDTYFRVLRMLQDNHGMTQREIAEKLGASTSGRNYCLKALIDKDLVKVQNFSQSHNKFGCIYVLTPQGIAEKSLLAGRFLKRKITEYEQFQSEIEALKVEISSPGGDAQKVQNA